MVRTGTEASNPRSAALDRMSTLEIVTLMNEEDATVPAAVERALPAVAAAVAATVTPLRRGGRRI